MPKFIGAEMTAEERLAEIVDRINFATSTTYHFRGIPTDCFTPKQDIQWLIETTRRLMAENEKLKNQLRASMLYAYEDTSDRYYLNVLDEHIPGWEGGAETISKAREALKDEHEEDAALIAMANEVKDEPERDFFEAMKEKE